MKERPVQYFSDEYLKQTKKISPSQAAEFVENYRQMIFSQPAKRKLISLRVPENILENFKVKAKQSGVRYQTMIVELMQKWILS